MFHGRLGVGSKFSASGIHDEGFLEAWVAVCDCMAESMGLGFNIPGVLGGSWDLVSKVIRTLIGVISTYKYSYLIYNPSY